MNSQINGCSESHSRTKKVVAALRISSTPGKRRIEGWVNAGEPASLLLGHIVLCFIKHDQRGRAITRLHAKAWLLQRNNGFRARPYGVEQSLARRAGGRAEVECAALAVLSGARELSRLSGVWRLIQTTAVYRLVSPQG